MLLSLAVGVALLDQTGPRPDLAQRSQANKQVAEDRELAGGISDLLGKNAMVLQLPLLGFPEDVIGFPARPKPSNLVVTGYEFYNGYELFRPSLYTDSLRWSYGAVQGRPDDLLPSFGSKPVDLFLRQAVATGYDGIYIDRRSLPDNGASLEAELKPHVGGPSLWNERAIFFDLRRYRDQLLIGTPSMELSRMKDEARRPLALEWKKGFEAPDGEGRFFPQLPELSSGRWAGNGAILEVTNSTGFSRTLTLHSSARLAVAGVATLATSSRDSPVQKFTITPAGSPIVLQTVIPPGTSRIAFATDRTDGVQAALPGHSLVFRLENVWWEG